MLQLRGQTNINHVLFLNVKVRLMPPNLYGFRE